MFFLDNYARLKIAHAEAMFLIHLVRYKWGADAPYPSLKTISARMGISAQMARCHARNLEKKGFLFRVMRKGETNRFDLAPLFAALETLQAVEARQKAVEENVAIFKEAGL